jgi:hypothetical protein
MKAALVIFWLSSLIPFTAQAVVYGGSNFSSFLGYPDHKCSKPLNKPYKPYSFDDQWEVDRYNDDVFRYNNSVTEYVDCIQEYVDNAKNDIKRIREKANDAIREANS